MKTDEFWALLSNDVKEYLSKRYYLKTRCLLSALEIESICILEMKVFDNKRKEIPHNYD